MRIGINGFGRIGRNFTKALLERHPGIEIAAVNDLTSPAECAHLFKYDSNYGTFEGECVATDDGVRIDGRAIKVFAERDPGKLPWRDLGVELVIDLADDLWPVIADSAGQSHQPRHQRAGCDAGWRATHHRSDKRPYR